MRPGSPGRRCGHGSRAAICGSTRGSGDLLIGCRRTGSGKQARRLVTDIARCSVDRVARDPVGAAGCRGAAEAVLTAQLAREALQTRGVRRHSRTRTGNTEC